MGLGAAENCQTAKHRPCLGLPRFGFLTAKVDRDMAKEMKTRKELADLVMREARARGKCADLQGIYVIGPVSRGHSNWDIGTSSDGPKRRLGSLPN